MKMEIWSEIACPWCGLGGHRLHRAVERFEHSGHAEAVHRSLPLGSGLPEDRTLSVREFVQAKYGPTTSRLAYRISKAWPPPRASNMLFRAYFGKAESIFRLDDLMGFSDRLGLDRDRTGRVLAGRRYRRQVQQDAHRAQRLGATGAPFTVIDGRYAIAGAQDTGTLLGIPRQAWDEAHPTVLDDNDAATCGPEGCAVPADHTAPA